MATSARQVWASKSADAIPSTLWPVEAFFEQTGPDWRMLDVGCGPGRLVLEYGRRGHLACGVDVNQSCLARAQAYAADQGLASSCHYVCASGSRLPFRDASWQGITLLAVLTTLTVPAERLALMAELHRVSAGGGLLYIQDFALNDSHPQYHARYKYHYPLTGEYGQFIVHDEQGREIDRCKHYTPAELETLLSRTGWTIANLITHPLRTRSGNFIEGMSIFARPG